MPAGSTRHIEPLLPNSPVPLANVRQARMRGLPVRRRTPPDEVVPTQVIVVDRSTMWSRNGQPRRPRGIIGRRARRFDPPGVQEAAPITGQKRRKFLTRTRRTRVEVTPPQFNPPFPFTELVQPKRLRGMLRGKTRRVEVPLGQAIPIESRSRRRFLARNKNRRPSEVVPVQQAVANPDFSWRTVRESRTVRGLSRRRGRGVEVVQSQVAPVAPALPLGGPQPRRLHGVLARRARRVEVVVAQEPVVITGRIRTRRANLRRAERSYEVVPPQVSVADASTMWSRGRQPRVLRGIPRTRGRRTDVVQAQLNPPLPILVSVQPRRARGLTRWRGRSFTPVPAQSAAFEVELRYAHTSRIRRLGRRQRRPGFDTVGQAAGPTSFVKTWDGLPRAAIKTFEGLANGTTKTVDGLP